MLRAISWRGRCHSPAQLPSFSRTLPRTQAIDPNEPGPEAAVRIGGDSNGGWPVLFAGEPFIVQLLIRAVLAQGEQRLVHLLA